MTKHATAPAPTPAFRSSAEIRAEHAAQVAAQATAQADLDRMRAARPNMLLSAPDDELDQHDSTMRKTERAIERAIARQSILLAELETARALEDQAGRRARYEAAKTLLAGLPLVEKKYGELVEAGRAIVRALATIGEAIDAANAALPEGYEALPHAEAFRSQDVAPRRIIHASTVELWIGANGYPLDDDQQRRVKRQPNGLGWVPGDYLPGEERERSDDGLWYPKKAYVKSATFVDVVYLKALRPRGLVSFARDLNIPAFRWDGPVGWRALEDGRPARVLSTLDQLEHAGPVLNPEKPEQVRDRLRFDAFEKQFGPIAELATA